MTPRRSLFTPLSSDRKGKCAWKCQKALPWVLFQGFSSHAQCRWFSGWAKFMLLLMRARDSGVLSLSEYGRWLSNTDVRFISVETSSFESVKTGWCCCISAGAKSAWRFALHYSTVCILENLSWMYQCIHALENWKMPIGKLYILPIRRL